MSLTDDRADDVLNLRSAIANLADEAICSDDPETVVRLWLMLEAIRDDAARAVAEVAEHGAKVLAGHDLYRLRIEGMPPVVRHTPKARNAWRKDELLGEVHRLVPQVDRLLSPSGEVEGDAEVAIRLVTDVFSLGGGKVTGLRKHGLDADEFCSVEVSPERLRIET